ncbi:probable sodium/metabolite cotransporter BASS4, chloroplastic [Diospyros lotus]|uniref:probable sodium/metabolite cotransporter BASS4, chloroplastic n=1 Tax=Diospyros lotus TaxID=55363 RepID=UPI00224C9AA2|nr:probable sodium/metabolite cotransporter BASS4, chloroplastic [Diospyros lotus]
MVMAGCLQTLCLRPPPAGAGSVRLGNPQFPATNLAFGHTFKSNPYPLFLRNTLSSSSPIRAGQPSDQVGGNPEQSTGASGFATALNWKNKLLSFALENFLPLALVGGVLLGLANPNPGCIADRYHLSKFSAFGIFIISGLTLRSEEIGEAAGAWQVGFFGLVSILLFTPFFSRLILQFNLQPQEFVTGLAIFCCMPTTLSSGVALTRLAGGNSALALAMTVISSLLGILIVPFSVSMFIAGGVGVSVPTKKLFRNLVLTLLVPLIFGKVFRESFKGVAAFVDRNRKLLSVISALFLSLVPWIQVSTSRTLLLMVEPTVFLTAVGMGMLLHLILLAFNVVAIRGLSAISGGSKSVFAKRENAIALLLVASQKTLPVMVAVVEQLGGALGDRGLLVLPCVAAHLNQIIMDSFFVNLWRQKEKDSLDNAKLA